MQSLEEFKRQKYTTKNFFDANIIFRDAKFLSNNQAFIYLDK
jgi:hypothetical protein